MATFYFIRHPETTADKGVCYGISDLPPKDGEVDKVRISIQGKVDLNKEIQFISSPLKRCKLLADSLANGKPVELNSLAKEIDFGSWEMTKWSEIPEEQQRVWSADYLNEKPYGGESFGEVVGRIKQFWEEITSDLSTDKIIVTHAGVLRALLVNLLDASPYKIFATDVQYGDVIRIEVYSKDYYKIRFL